MSIPLEVLVKWSRPGKSDNSRVTYMKLREIISSKLHGDYDEIFLQGSFHNKTHVKDYSDIDVVILNKDILIEKQSKELVNNLNMLKQYSSYVYTELVKNSVFGFSKSNKIIKFIGDNNYVSADIVPCGIYKNDPNASEIGIIIYDNKIKKFYVNYPKQHFYNGSLKSKNTNGNFKKAIRMFKSARNYIIKNRVIGNAENIAPSYFLECLLYNVPNSCFLGNEQNVFHDVVDWLFNHIDHMQHIKCQNDIQYLFGNNNSNDIFIYKRWHIEDAKQFVLLLTSLWNRWR